jgi:SPASM domain peptide maturase of grasp-with-spasm system
MIYKKYKENTYLIMFSSIQLVKGARRTLLVDLERNVMRFLPNDLYNFIDKCKSKTLLKVLSSYCEDDQTTAKEYVDFLVRSEYAFHTDEPERFPPLSLSWKSPCKLTNAVIDINATSKHDYDTIVNSLNSARCQSADFRVFEQLDSNELEAILSSTSESTLESVRVYIPYTMWNGSKYDNKLFIKYPRLNTLIIYNAPENRIVDNHDGLGALCYIVESINSPECCGYVSEKLMLGNLYVYTESLHHNSCLNRKLSIDVNGFVKNCSVQDNNFGYYKNINFLDLIDNNKEFTKYWNITKDHVDTCCACEFRYSCIDCRFVLDEESNIYSKPKRCHYDPYTATWKNNSLQ